MPFPGLARYLLGAFTVATLIVSPACNKKQAENAEIQDLSQKAAVLDSLSQKANVTGADQTRKLKEAGVNDVKPNPDTLQLSEPQKAALEARIKAEKNSSYQGLLQEVLDKDKELGDLNDKIAKLRAVLPKPDIARDNDSHYGLAMRFLKKQGVHEEHARLLVSRVFIMEKLSPGFQVYHFYSNGAYGTWVAQGKATVTPTELQAEEKPKIEGERDSAQAESAKLQEDLTDLSAQKEKIIADLAGLQTEKTAMITELEGMSANNEAQKAKLNSVHYLVGERKGLEAKGIIIVPVFAKDRAGANWADSIFTKALDLRTQDTITLTAAELGLPKIGKISVIPGSLVKDQHYTVTLSADKATATIKLLAKERFRNEKVVFAVTD